MPRNLQLKLQLCILICACALAADGQIAGSPSAAGPPAKPAAHSKQPKPYVGADDVPSVDQLTSYDQCR